MRNGDISDVSHPTSGEKPSVGGSAQPPIVPCAQSPRFLRRWLAIPGRLTSHASSWTLHLPAGWPWHGDYLDGSTASAHCPPPDESARVSRRPRAQVAGLACRQMLYVCAAVARPIASFGVSSSVCCVRRDRRFGGRLDRLLDGISLPHASSSGCLSRGRRDDGRHSGARASSAAGDHVGRPAGPASDRVVLRAACGFGERLHRLEVRPGN